MTPSGRLILWIFLSLAINIGWTAGERKNWVLLVAGANGWHNYAMQSDMCHAYQIAHEHGIPDEQIIVMMYDDIAHSDYNPWPGVIINQPDGPNVYEGVPKDYNGEDVNPDVFYKVLQGDKEGIKQLLGRDGKVVDSGPEDHIFISYGAHGNTGYVCMPTGDPPRIYANDLNEVLKDMHAQKKFAKLTFLIDTCMSGSMFDKLLPDDINVYGNSASKPDECSCNTYYIEDLKACVAGEFSSSWMENCDEVDISTETIQEQYEIVCEKTTKSHPMQYGDLSITSLMVDQFLGKPAKPAKLNSTTSRKAYSAFPRSSDNMPMFIIQQLMAGPMGKKYVQELSQSLEEHRWLLNNTQKIMEDVVNFGLSGEDSAWAFRDHPKVKDWNCYKHAIDRLTKSCPRLSEPTNDYITKRMHVLANLCNSRSELTVMEAIKKAVMESSFCDV